LPRSTPTSCTSLQRLWLIEAVKYNVLPLDDRRVERFNSDIAGRPELVKGNSQLLYGGMGRLTENSVINLKNKSHAVTADIVVPEGGGERRDHRPGWRVRGLGALPARRQARVLPQPLSLQRFKAFGDKPVPAGTHQVRMEFDYDGGWPRKGREHHPVRRRQEVRRGPSDTRPSHDLLRRRDVRLGSDTGTPVSDDYTSEGSKFTGTVNWVQLDAGNDDQDHLITPGGTPTRRDGAASKCPAPQSD